MTHLNTLKLQLLDYICSFLVHPDWTEARTHLHPLQCDGVLADLLCNGTGCGASSDEKANASDWASDSQVLQLLDGFRLHEEGLRWTLNNRGGS